MASLTRPATVPVALPSELEAAALRMAGLARAPEAAARIGWDAG